MKTISTALSILLMFSLTGCLKTRAQIKGEGADSNDSSDSMPDEGKTSATAKGPGRYEFDELKNEMTRLSGKVDEVDHKLRSSNYSELKEYVTRLDGRIAELEKNQLLVMSELKALKDEKAEVAKAAATPSADIYTLAQNALAKQDFEGAAEKFRQLLARNLKGKEASEVHFGLAEAEYGLKNYKKAIVEYSKVQEFFPKSNRIPTSLYKIGLSFQKLNMTKEAKGFFSELAERYPKSPEAKKARAKVKE